jgi:uncharacterized protein (TIGR04255 family)
MAYSKPPITEAVLELRFASPISQTAIENAARRFEGAYPQAEKEEGTEFTIDAAKRDQPLTPQWIWSGLKVHTADRANTLLFRKSTFACIRLAPYLGWEDFRGRAQGAWESFKKSVGSIEVSRIGLRYVNRIDIPNAENPLIKIDEYLNVLPKTPAMLTKPMTSFTLQAARPIGEDECSVNITSSTLASPLINFASLALDIDVFRTKDIPRREDQLWPLIEKMREHKNSIFEASVTDKARELFA